jgi:hypothetical protein
MLSQGAPGPNGENKILCERQGEEEKTGLMQFPGFYDCHSNNVASTLEAWGAIKMLHGLNPPACSDQGELNMETRE